MPARATASATISFGLVSIPVKVYSATQSKAIRFNMLDPKDHSRVKQQYVSASSGEAVERSDLVRGYEHARGRFVVMTDDELKALERAGDRSIEIEEFVPIEAVDPVYFDRANLLGPDKGGQKAYHLLHRAMLDMGKVAVGRFATRGRQQLVLLRPAGPGLMLHGLFYADEVRSFDEIELDGAAEPRANEVKLANQLIAQLSSDEFRPERYEDEYRQAILAAVERKVEGQEIAVPPQEEQREQIIDLVAALKKSLAEKGDGARKPARAKGAKKTGRRRAGGKSA